MARTPSRLYRLIEDRLDGTLVDFVAERRRVDGPPFGTPTGWRDIAAELHKLTGIEVSHEALRNWFGTEAETATTAGGTR